MDRHTGLQHRLDELVTPVLVANLGEPRPGKPLVRLQGVALPASGLIRLEYDLAPCGVSALEARRAVFGQLILRLSPEPRGVGGEEQGGEDAAGDGSAHLDIPGHSSPR